MKSAVSILLLSLIQLNQSIILPTPGCGGIPYCKSYKPDTCNTCSCSDPVYNPKLAMCTLAFCEVPPTFIPQCTSCMDGYIFDTNKNCVKLSLPPVEPIPITIDPNPPALPPVISIAPLPIKPCICTQDFTPVCCSDGQTYSNYCHAACNGLIGCKTGQCLTSIPEPITIDPPITIPIKPIPLPIDPLPCKYLPACQDPCGPYYYNLGAYPYRYPYQGVRCQGYPNARCQSKIDCSGCYAVFVDEYDNEIKCIPPPPDPITCNTDVNCQTWMGFYCRPDIKCTMAANVDPVIARVPCNKVCYNTNGMCSVNTDCTAGYDCIEGFCVTYQTEYTPIYVIGRPYNIGRPLDLKAGVKQIDCKDYKFYFNDMEFANERNVSVSDEVIFDWIDRALSEHAAIGTFSKFNLDLMSIGVPLWFLKTANNASLDEIEHAKISFDIVNMYIKHASGNLDEQCISFGEFPIHNIKVDGDYNRISLDAANGGCFGETLSVFMTYLNGYDSDNNIIQSYLHGVAMDEIRHASLSWVAVKWIIDQRGDKVEVVDVNWWKTRLLQMNKKPTQNTMRDNVEQYVYKYVIPSILKILWADNGDLIQMEDYDRLYHSINSLLEDHLNAVIAKMIE